MSDPNWLKEPDASGDAVVYVSIPEGSQLTPELTDALTRLGKALQDLGKETPNTPTRRCATFHSCNLEACQPYTIQNCLSYLTCRIKE
jgi:hypothetical protein